MKASFIDFVFVDSRASTINDPKRQNSISSYGSESDHMREGKILTAGTIQKRLCHLACHYTGLDGLSSSQLDEELGQKEEGVLVGARVFKVMSFVS
jgi:hypothetical protein